MANYVDPAITYQTAKSLFSTEAAGKLTEGQLLERCPQCSTILVERGRVGDRGLYECLRCRIPYVRLGALCGPPAQPRPRAPTPVEVQSAAEQEAAPAAPAVDAMADEDPPDLEAERGPSAGVPPEPVRRRPPSSGGNKRPKRPRKKK